MPRDFLLVFARQIWVGVRRLESKVLVRCFGQVSGGTDGCSGLGKCTYGESSRACRTPLRWTLGRGNFTLEFRSNGTEFKRDGVTSGCIYGV